MEKNEVFERGGKVPRAIFGFGRALAPFGGRFAIAACIGLMCPAATAAEPVLGSEHHFAGAFANEGPRSFELVRAVLATGERAWWSDAQNRLLGVVKRATWLWWLRHELVYENEDGTVRAHGSLPWSWRLVSRRLSDLEIRDGDDNDLLTVRVRWSLFSGYRYELRNARGDVVANAVADQTARRVCISPPAGTGQPIATFALQGASDGVACWGFELLVPGVVPADAWPILAAYFAHDRDVYEAHEQLIARWEAERQRVAAQAERRADADFYQVIADLAQHAVSGIFDPEDTSEPTSDTESTGTPQWPPPLRFPEREGQQFEAPLRTQPAAPHRPRSSMPVRSRPADDGRPGVHGRIRTKMTEAMQSFASLPDDDQAVKDRADEIVEELRVYCRHLPDDQALRGGIGLLQAFMDVTYESAQWQPQAP